MTVAGIRSRKSTFDTASTESFLLAARSALRKQAPPVEAPINPINAPLSKTSLKAQMTGRPSVNLPSEKMGAFLTEVKSAKLKKVSSTKAPPLTSDNARVALARSLSGTAKGKELLRDIARRKSTTELHVQAGQKRKRYDTDTETQAEACEYKALYHTSKFHNRCSVATTSKRVATEVSLTVSDASTSSVPSSSNFSNIGSYSQANPTWPSISTTDTDLTTPSLCSDNENDEASPEDALPPTPPRRPPTPPRRLKKHPSRNLLDTPDVDKSLPEIIDIGDECAREGDAVIEGATLAPINTAVRQRTASTSSVEDAFARRLPTSPLPAVVAKKPKPPGRSRATLHIQRITYSEPDGTANQSAFAHPPITVSKATPSAQALKKPAIRTPKSCTASTGQFQEESPQETRSSPHERMRRTLDAELRRAGDHLWEGNETEDGLEDGIFTAVGVKDMQGGFLARGGGGGSPVYMGVGYVQGAEDYTRDGQTRRTNMRVH
jgi:hypothetical protein